VYDTQLFQRRKKKPSISISDRGTEAEHHTSRQIMQVAISLIPAWALAFTLSNKNVYV
jgi:hypothetical protein